jgi:predicted metal-binding membrane protein
MRCVSVSRSPLFLTTVVVAWLLIVSLEPAVLAGSGGSPAWLVLRLAQAVCGATGGADGARMFAQHLAIWELMVIAMMGPASVPLLNALVAATRIDCKKHALRTAAICGYVVAWNIFGLAAWTATTGFRLLGSRFAFAEGNDIFLASILVFVAGGYQISKLKGKFLVKCSFERLSKKLGSLKKVRLRDFIYIGMREGLNSISCCWALMLIMFVGGADGCRYMLLVTAVMLIEQHNFWGLSGRILSGIALIAVAGTLVSQTLI